MTAVNRVFLTVAFVSLVLFATTRTTGLDYQVYLNEFVDPVGQLSSREVGYVALLKLVGQFSDFWFVLLIANLVFLISHGFCISRARSLEQVFAVLVYLVFISLFLVFGSPRRLIAYSLVAYIISEIVLRPQDASTRIGRNCCLIALASVFHASALVFAPVFVAYTYRKNWLRTRAALAGAILVPVIGTLAYQGGAVDHLIYKFLYYSVDAAAEPEGYLAEVPSVLSGMIKRLVAISLLWLGVRRIPEIGRPVLDFCIIEMTVYGLLGLLSPVLAVAANYFSIAYLLPVLLLKNRSSSITRTGVLFLGVAIVYYVPTSVGLIRLLGEFYVP